MESTDTPILFTAEMHRLRLFGRFIKVHLSEQEGGMHK